MKLQPETNEGQEFPNNMIIEKAEEIVIACYYLASDLLDLKNKFNIVDIEKTRELSIQLSLWADSLSVVLAEFRKFEDEGKDGPS
jgi:hypothetical protein